VDGNRRDRTAVGKFAPKRRYCRAESENGITVDGDALTEFRVCELERNGEERLLTSTVANTAWPWTAGTDANPTDAVHQATATGVSEIRPSVVLPRRRRSNRELWKTWHL
jgi:hypothetical protein